MPTGREIPLSLIITQVEECLPPGGLRYNELVKRYAMVAHRRPPTVKIHLSRLAAAISNEGAETIGIARTKNAAGAVRFWRTDDPTYNQEQALKPLAGASHESLQEKPLRSFGVDVGFGACDRCRRRFQRTIGPHVDRFVSPVLTLGPVEFGACFVHDRIWYNGIRGDYRNRRATATDVELVSLGDELGKHLNDILCPLDSEKWNRAKSDDPGNWLMQKLEDSLRRTGTSAAWRLHRAIYGVAEPSVKVKEGEEWHRIGGKWMKLVALGAHGPVVHPSSEGRLGRSTQGR